MYYKNNKFNKPFTVKKPVRSFRDLDVYQKTMECSVLITKDLVPVLEKLKYGFMENMVNCSLNVPLNVGEAHSMRFASFEGGVAILERAMSGCNKMVIYLEQIKGVYGSKVDGDLIDDIIGRYMENRTKMWHLEKAWKKFRESGVTTSPSRANFKY